MQGRTSPEAFASSFNQKFPGAYRLITVEDVNDMTECGLIGRYGFYLKNVDLSERYGFNKQDDSVNRYNLALRVVPHDFLASI